MPPPEEPRRRVARKLTKKRKEERIYTMEIPKRFEDGPDADEDCTAPKGQSRMINQSVFGLIAAAGSQIDFNTRFEDIDDDEDDEPQMSTPQLNADTSEPKRNDEYNDQKRKPTHSRLFKSLSNLGGFTSSIKKHKPKLPTLSQSTTEPELSSSVKQEPRSQLGEEDMAEMDTASGLPHKGPPVMAQMLAARDEAAERGSFDLRRSYDQTAESSSSGEQGTHSSLAQRLKEIFDFDTTERVVDEFPCWLMKSVLLQGYLYVTSNHICFYAYLPKKTQTVVKSGYLTKRGYRNPTYNRYWFQLKGDVLSYYSNPADKYFPAGNIDLRYGISASVTPKERGGDPKGSTYFEVVTHSRSYQFQADSAPSAKEWVKALQKIIFRSHNEGDSVKISLPIENIIDVEDSQIVEFADTCKIRVVDNAESFAIDEYFFSFFAYGKQALQTLQLLVEDTAAKKLPEEVLKPMQGMTLSNDTSPRTSMSGPRHSFTMPTDRLHPVVPPLRPGSPALGEVRATLSPHSPVSGRSPRPSGEFARSSFDFDRSKSQNRGARRSGELNRMTLEGRRSESDSRRSYSRPSTAQKKTTESQTQDSSDSYVHSMEQASAMSMSEDTQGSASHILRSSDGVFQPTMRRSISGSRKPDETPLATSQMLPPRRTSSRDKIKDPSKVKGEVYKKNTSVDGGSNPSLQSLVKAGAYPLQRAAGFANYLTRHSKKMSNLLATESMGYAEKVSGMWKGGQTHYDSPAGSELQNENDRAQNLGQQVDGAEERFHCHFALPPDEKLQATYYTHLQRVLPLYGKIYISEKSFCYRSLLPGTRTKVILPLKDVENVTKEKGFTIGRSGLVIVVKGHEELLFEFGQVDSRDDCCVTLLRNLENIRYLRSMGQLDDDDEEREAAAAKAEHKNLQKARQLEGAEHDLKLPTTVDKVLEDAPPLLFDDPTASFLNFTPNKSLRITCLTIGSRGDVQPYIALCKGLMKDGHKCKIATHEEFRDWVEGHGIEFATVDGNPAELMQICVDYGMFTYKFLREASSRFRGWIDDLLASSWKACQNSDILIESPSAMAGIHIAEALGIPYFRAFTMPWTRTRAFPHAFAVPEHKMGGAYNYFTYVVFDAVFWKAIAGQVNRWRKKQLHLGPTSLEKMQPNKVPFLYNFSPYVVIPPLDYSDWVRITGYWFLDEGVQYTPPKELLDFIQKARDDGKPIVYVGFGSIVVPDANELLRVVVESVLKAEVRCVLNRGWSDRLSSDEQKQRAPIKLPPDVMEVKSVPHDWLFTQVDAVVSHGGAGTTGATLRAGKPTIINPFFGDQFFFAGRVEDLGVGIFLRKMNVSYLARAMWEATKSEHMIVKAKILGEQIRSEIGVDKAIQCIYRDMEYAKSLIKRRPGEIDPTLDSFDDIEESWTFIGDEEDADILKRLRNYDGPRNDGLNEQANLLKSLVKESQGGGQVDDEDRWER